MPTTRTDPFSIRLPTDLENRLYAVIAATGCEVTKSGLIARALATYFALLDACPTLLEGYDRSLDRSVTQEAPLSHMEDE